jgi:hypothetical protein
MVPADDLMSDRVFADNIDSRSSETGDFCISFNAEDSEVNDTVDDAPLISTGVDVPVFGVL